MSFPPIYTELRLAGAPGVHVRRGHRPYGPGLRVGGREPGPSHADAPGAWAVTMGKAQGYTR